MTPLQYLNAVRNVLEHLEQTQLPAIEKAADLVVHALTHQGMVYCANIGHGLQADFIHRAGGLAAVQPFNFRLELADEPPRVLNRPAPDRDLQTARFAVQTSRLQPGDVMVIGSVSGRNRVPIELALACRERGVRTIGLTALAYSQRVDSAHPCGKKLCEVVDVVIDIGAPYGDAAVDIAGYRHKLLPVSGVGFLVAGHMLWGCVMEKMAALGKPATVFQSVNLPGGAEELRRAEEQYQQQGY